MRNLRKLLSATAVLGLITVSTFSVIACSDTSQAVKFNYKNLISTENLQTQTQDNNGNLYYATFDNNDINILGEKIWKYNISTKKKEIYWQDQNFKVGSFNMAVDSKGNIYLGSAGGVQILYDKNKSRTMPLASNMTTHIIYFKNNIYVTTFNGFYKYNIDTENTEKIDLLNNSIVNCIFIDKNENFYLSVYNKPTNYSVLIIKKGEFEAKPIIGDDFFNTNDVNLITEINNKIYFYSLNSENDKAKLYYSDLDNIQVNYLLDLSVNVKKIFNLNNEIGLVIQDNYDTTIQVLNINGNISLDKKYEIKNNFYNQIIQNLNNLYLSYYNKIDCLSW